MAEVTISGQLYTTVKLPIFKQFHIARILCPVIWAGPPFYIVQAFSKLSQGDAEYVVNSCLEVVQRKQEANWANVGSLQKPMFADMALLDYYEVSAAVITESLGSFFPDLLSKISAKTNLKA